MSGVALTLAIGATESGMAVRPLAPISGERTTELIGLVVHRPGTSGGRVGGGIGVVAVQVLVGGMSILRGVRMPCGVGGGVCVTGRVAGVLGRPLLHSGQGR